MAEKMTKPIVSEAMVEAGARAIYWSAKGPGDPKVWALVDDEMREWISSHARACLEAALAVRDQEQ